MHKDMSRVELLAPAGDMSKLVTAFHFGADAVYVGGSDFGLRAGAANFGAKIPSASRPAVCLTDMVLSPFIHLMPFSNRTGHWITDRQVTLRSLTPFSFIAAR